MRMSGKVATLVLLCGLQLLSGQTLLVPSGAQVHLVNDDMAMLESQTPRKDLPCEVKPVDPSLGFDLRFHAGYDVRIPLRELVGDENKLTMIFRVTPQAAPDKRLYFTQTFRVPHIDENAGGDSTLSGTFDVGEGKYHVDFLMKDRDERVCTFFWDSTAELSGRDKEIQMGIEANTPDATSTEQFKADPPVQRTSETSLNVKILVNFGPQNQNSSALRPSDTLALVTMLRRITREPRIGKFSIAAFNIQEQRVIYRQSSADQIDFPALGKAVDAIAPGLLDVRLLANKRSEVEFLTGFIKEELTGRDRPDALIFVGPKYTVTEGSPENELKSAEAADYPVFYLNYNVSPKDLPWRDSIGRAVRFFGGREYSVTRPRELWFSVTEIVNRIVESKAGAASNRPRQVR
jgi:hypothetical protein